MYVPFAGLPPAWCLEHGGGEVLCSQEVISPPQCRPSMVQVKFLALDEADRMLDMGTLARWEFLYGLFRRKTTTKKGGKVG